MSPEQRREAIVEATIPLLFEHGRQTTTRLIAEAAGIAEGTVFRVFGSKEELFDAVVGAVMDPGPFLAELDRVDPGLALRERMVELTAVLQRRLVRVFQLMIKMALAAPPKHHRTGPEDAGDSAERPHEEWRRQASDRMIALLEPDREAFRLPLSEVVRTLRLLTFSGSHPHLSDGQPMHPDQIVDVILLGTLAPHSRKEADAAATPA